MLGKNPLAISPLATLAGGIQSISIPASLVVTGSAGNLSLVCSVLPDTGSASALSFAPALKPALILDTAAATASALAPTLLSSVEPTTSTASAFAVDPNLLYTVELASPDIASALATQMDLQAFVVTDVASAEAAAVDPDITPILAIIIDAVTAQATAFDPALLSNLVIDGISAAPALAEDISLIPNLSLDVAVAEATSVDPYLINNVLLQAAQVAQAFADSPTLNLSVVIDDAALSVATTQDLKILPGIFVSPAYAIALQQDLGLSGSIFLQYAPAIAVTDQINLLYSASLDTVYSQAAAIDPIVQLQIELNSPAEAVASASAPTLSLSVAPVPATANAIAQDPLLAYNIQLSTPVASASVTDLALQLDVTLDYAVSNAAVGAIDIIPFVKMEPAIVAAIPTAPLLVYNVILQTSTTATAAAISPVLHLSVVPSQVLPASASAFSPSVFVAVKPVVAMSYANATSPELEYFILASTALAIGQAIDPATQLSTVLGPAPVAIVTATQPTLFVTVEIFAPVATATANDPSFTYEISPTTIIAPAYAIDPLLEYNIIQASPALALALSGTLKISRTAGTYYIDPVAGNDTNDGLSWATAWKTMTFGATEPNIISGDFIRIAKTSDPVAIGCLWTSGSKSVALSVPRTLGIDDCESGWTAANGSTVNHVTSTKKQGTACVGVDVPTYASNSVYAYKTIPVTNASAYQGLSFWYRVESGIVDSGRWELCLCSDTLGTTIVDRFQLPGHPAADRWMPLNVFRSGSGNLGASIQSIALYTTSTPPISSHTVLLDNIQATKVDDLNLTSLISKDGSPTGGVEGYWGIQSISGSAVLLDRDTNCDAGSGFGYYGVTEDVPTYIRETYKVPPAPLMLTSSLFNVNNSGTPGASIIYSGGWNTGSNVQDGQTYYDGQNGLGLAFYSNNKSFISASNMSFYRFGSAFYAEGECVGHDINMPNASNCSNVAVSMNDRFLLGSVVLGNVNSNGSPDISGSCGVSITNGSMDDVVHVQRALSNWNSAVSLECVNNVRFIGPSLIANNPRGVEVADCGAGIFVEDTTFDNIIADTSNDSSRLTLVNASMTGSAVHFEHSTNYGYSQKTLSHNHNSTGTNLVSHGGGLITSMVTNRPGGSGLMWQLLTSDSARDSFNPLPLYAGQVYCIANSTTVVKAWLKKDHATQVNGRLAARGRQLAGIPNNVTATLANNTGWQELSISLTPTESGVVQIEVWAEYVSGHQPVYYDQGLTVV